ncbi:MAG TPA: inositol monophosphatase family protein [Candidatus Saccharimonadales bacterium]|nr:inositol monophosphatase family protein [Candidatus Saccharimonadales bacterium]
MKITESLKQVEAAFKQVRHLILDGAGKAEHTSKADGSPVTQTDVAVEEKLTELLTPHDIPVFGEESGYNDEQLPDTCWLIDPIDGTKNFIANSPTFTSMAALIHNKQTVAAIIYNPSTNDVFTAQKGLGAFKNGERLTLAAKPLPSTAWCKDQFTGELTATLQPKHVVCQPITTGGGFGFTQVAEGLIAARFQLWAQGYTHDYAPGALLVSEAGGIILPILDNEYTFTTKCFVACHPELEPIIRQHIPRLRELELQRS